MIWHSKAHAVSCVACTLLLTTVVFRVPPLCLAAATDVADIIPETRAPKTAPTPSAARGAMSVGPDLMVGPLEYAYQAGREGAVGSGTVGLAVNTTGCNKGNTPIDWFALPSIDHPLMTGNFYRLRTVAGSDRMEQIGYGWVKHGFGAAQEDACSLGCTPHFNQQKLGVGCSDPYSADQLAEPCDGRPRSGMNPYTVILPGGASLGGGGGCFDNYPSRNHIGHVHDNISHRIQVPDTDLIPALNSGARYFGEVHYLVPHEYTAGIGLQNNNVSHGEFTVVEPGGDGLFILNAVASPPLLESPTVDSWPGSFQTVIEPAPLTDGRSILAYKATPIGAGLWHYEYAMYNMNLDRAVGSFSVPVPTGVVVSNIGFHAPRHHAPELNAETYPNTPWAVSTTGAALTWATDSFAVDPLANALRWGTTYNFRFDANTPPQSVTASVGLFKTGTLVNAATIGPSPVAFTDCNGNTIDDRCDLSCAPPGCSIPNCGLSADCTSDGIPDECQADCNGNTVADVCELAAATATDCNGNGIIDTCEPGSGIDCNGNGPDFCDLLLGTSFDYNHNNIPDDCESNRVLQVDDDALGDPGPGDSSVSDPAENGSAAHPFDAVQKAVNMAINGDLIVLHDGTYRGIGNRGINFGGRSVVVRSLRGPNGCIIDAENANESTFFFASGEPTSAGIRGLTLKNSAASAVECNGGRPAISDCIFRDNENCVLTYGGADVVVSNCKSFNSRIAFYSYYTHLTIANSLIDGGQTGFYSQGGVSIVRNTTFTRATVAAVQVYDSTVQVRNSVFWGNTGEAIRLLFNGAANVQYSDVQGAWPGTGNVNVDPLFVNAVAGDFHLTALSLCRNAGDPGFVPLPGERDIDGEARVGGSAVDVGADEYTDCTGNGAPDYQDIAGGAADCNANGVPDSCESTALDCNGNTVWDPCDIAANPILDCNANLIPDPCDIASGASVDCNGNFVPDECESDCNRNGLADSCDIGTISTDCNGNGVPDICEADCNKNGIADSCEIAGDPDCNANLILDACETDCNGNMIPDGCEILSNPSLDCTGNGVLDECEPDCNGNLRADSCDIALFLSPDCNTNGIPDECELALGAPDCNHNQVIDLCEIALGSSPDCDGNQVPDSCDLARGAADCNGNARLDTCDILERSLLDADKNGVPDVCQPPMPLPAPAPHDRRKNRYLSFAPVGGLPLAYQLRLVSPPAGMVGWISAPNASGLSSIVSSPVFRNWSEPVVHVGDCGIFPVAEYDLRCTGTGTIFSPPLSLFTIAQPTPKFWGDTVGSFGNVVAGQWDPPNGVVNVNDYVAALQKFLGVATAPHLTVVDVQAVSSTDPCLNKAANIADVFLLIKAFQGNLYPFVTDPAQCPPCP